MTRILSSPLTTTRPIFPCPVSPCASASLFALFFSLFLLMFQPFAAAAQGNGPDYGSALSATSSPTSTTSSPASPLAPRSDLLDSRSPDSGDADIQIDPADIPDILMQEVNRVERNCRRNYMYSSFHDCRCIAIKYLDARLKSDPEKTPDYLVYNQVAATCVDEASIAGYIYPSCYDVMQLSRPETYRPFCQCVANRVARLYAAQPVVNLGYIDRLRENAFKQCGIY